MEKVATKHEVKENRVLPNEFNRGTRSTLDMARMNQKRATKVLFLCK